MAKNVKVAKIRGNWHEELQKVLEVLMNSGFEVLGDDYYNSDYKTYHIFKKV